MSDEKLFEIADELIYTHAKDIDFLTIAEHEPPLTPAEQDRVWELIALANVNVSWQDNV